MSGPAIYGALNSRASRAVWLAEEMGLTYRHVPVIQASRLADPHAPGAPLNTDSPAFRSIAPRGRIPVIDDGGIVVTESLAILLHLALSRGGALAPATGAERARLLELAFWSATTLEPDGVTIIVNRAIRSPEDCDEAACEAAEKRLARNLEALEGGLDAGWLLGARFTAADVIVAEVLRYALPGRGVFDDAPRVADWLARCQARPAFREVAGRRAAEAVPEGWQRAYRRSGG